MSVSIIVAVGNYNVYKGWPIGKNGSIPWHNKADLKWFKETTTGHPIIMGKKTWESIGSKPLPDRLNIIVTHDTNGCEWVNGAYKVSSVEEAITLAKGLSKEDVFIIGGASIYKYALEHNLVDTVLIDYLSEEVEDADTFFNFNYAPNVRWETEGQAVEVEKGKAYATTYVRISGDNNNVDSDYLNLVNDIIENGEKKDTRAGKTRSVFSRQLRFNLKKGLPMLTTKKMFSKGVIHELLWFIKGDTNIKYLVDNGVHIWDDDAYRYYMEICEKHFGPLGEGESYSTKEEFLEHVKNEDSFTTDNGFHYTFGDLNRVYGAQWTNWGGHNQVKEVIETLKKNPDDRRMIISAWNVDEIPDMALPPCHFCCQFYTRKMTLSERIKWAKDHSESLNLQFISITPSDLNDEDTLNNLSVPSRKLSCVWHQRSVDSLLGLPFNIMSYAILTHMIAQCANMDVDELIFDGGDVHVYENQIEEYEKTQKSRNPHKYGLPTLELNTAIKNITDFKYEDIVIKGYESYPTVKYPLSVG